VCVVGIPDEEWGQQVAAVIVADDKIPVSAEALDAFLRVRLAGYKRPRQYRFVDELPLTASGKVKRTQVKALFEE
jgi:acyl-CoA synthetase (AMP-forming)/AMP-acid ligase II